MSRIAVQVLGATGLVGQRLVSLLERHPWFETTSLCASERSAGRAYGEVCRWRLDAPPPPGAAGLVVGRCEPVAGCELVFSALDAETARDVEPRFAAAGRTVITNASALRLEADVPLVIPEVNAGHLDALPLQRRRGWSGCVVANPNCTTTTLALVLAPLKAAFGLARAQVVTMQAVSGAGYPGVAALDVLGNVVPGIEGEAAKIAAELPRILGAGGPDGFRPAGFALEALTTRVAVADGHTAGLFVELDDDPSAGEVIAVLREWRPLEPGLLPSAPQRPVVVIEAPDRPQPRLDLNAGGGMASVVGALERSGPRRYRMMVLGHNTVRGAAGGALLNAELVCGRGYAGGGRSAADPGPCNQWTSPFSVSV
jgi:aspartate-semialdehyde dehydrogenase